MSPFNLADYEPVEERLARFWKDHPQGRIHTEMVLDAPSIKSVVMLAQVWKDKKDADSDATGFAQETQGEGMVNKTSWIENCETSAIGRALANMGYAPKGSRPSREEMAKAAAPRTESPSAGRRTPTKRRASHIRLLQAAKDAGVDDDLRHRITRMFTGQTSVKELSDEDADKVTKNLAWLQLNRHTAITELEKWEAKQ